jgi:thiamine pyrophosphate-dependent acetolactate synthase large subunit-like protein
MASGHRIRCCERMSVAARTTPIRLDQLTVPTQRPQAPEWGSDVVAEMLRRLRVEYVSLVPGSSFRGLHDSLVNYNGNQMPSLILANHEEVAVAIAHGYAKVRGRAMASIVHSNVGLMHATMAVFNAFEDRQPLLLLGGNGPMDATRRRPGLDWVHTTQGQGELVRPYTKWEHQPATIAALPDALLRAWHAAHTEPAGPVYVDLDAGWQEQRLDSAPAISLPDPAEFPVPKTPAPAPELVRQAADWLIQAEFPVILPGRLAQTEQAWTDLVTLAELLGAAVLMERRSTGSFPTDHVLCQAGMGARATGEAASVMRQADVVLALERSDPAGTLRGALTPPGGTGRDGWAHLTWPRLINVSLQPLHFSSWMADYHELPRAGLPILAGAELTLQLLLEEVRRRLADSDSARERVERRLGAHREARARLETEWSAAQDAGWAARPVSVARALVELRDALGERYPESVLAYLPLAWPSGAWHFSRPGAYIGGDGGAGIGAGPGLTVGAALAHADSQRPVIGVVGDGAMLMAPSALWTAAHHRIPALLVVVNNQSYFNDEEHQDRVARTRGRPPENRWIGQRMDEPGVDFAALARSLGVEGFGPIEQPDDLRHAVQGAVRAVTEGRPALVEIRTASR